MYVCISGYVCSRAVVLKLWYMYDWWYVCPLLVVRRGISEIFKYLNHDIIEM